MRSRKIPEAFAPSISPLDRYLLDDTSTPHRRQRSLSKRKPVGGRLAFVGALTSVTAVARGKGASVLFICCCCICCFIVIIAITASASTAYIVHANDEGCTRFRFDNYQRGYGIDNGSCFIEHKFAKNVKVCGGTQTFALYYDSGGLTEDYQQNENSTLDFVVAENNACFEFVNFQVAGADSDCTDAFLRVGDEKKCAQKDPFTLGEPMTCTNSSIEFQFFSSSTATPTAGWLANIHCGVPGCLSNMFENYDDEATIDDYTCEELHKEANHSLCTFASYYDSGGLTGVYKANESSTEMFTSSDTEKTLCFLFDDFDVHPSDSLTVIGSAANDGVYNNANPIPAHLCALATIEFLFESDLTAETSGWRARTSCL